MRKKKFFFIVFEGVEGTGKSYQINKLHKNLILNKYHAIKTREPGGCYTAEKIRNLIFSNNSSHFDKLTDFYLMCASRNEHIKKFLQTAKKKKNIVICDRFVDSTYAYQVIGNKIDKNLNKLNQDHILNGLTPNLTILLRSDFKTVIARIKKRKKTNKFDKLKINFYKKAQNAYLSIAKNNKKYYIFDSSKDTTDLEKKIFNLIIKKLQ
jgi:dTMP kinase